MPKMVQIRNMPDDLHRKMKARAAAAGMSLSDYLLNEVRMAAERPTMEEFKARLARLTPVTLSESVEDAVRAERDSR
jgi:antitoxin FitA